MHPAIILGTVRSLWTRLWGRYHVPQNAFLVVSRFFSGYAQADTQTTPTNSAGLLGSVDRRASNKRKCSFKSFDICR